MTHNCAVSSNDSILASKSRTVVPLRSTQHARCKASPCHSDPNETTYQPCLSHPPSSHEQAHGNPLRKRWLSQRNQRLASFPVTALVLFRLHRSQETAQIPTQNSINHALLNYFGKQIWVEVGFRSRCHHCTAEHGRESPEHETARCQLLFGCSHLNTRTVDEMSAYNKSGVMKLRVLCGVV